MPARARLSLMLSQVSIVVPLAPGESAWTALVNDLVALPRGAELLFASHAPPEAGMAATAHLCGARLRIAWIRTPRGRARQMNLAARASRKPYLWFLHADSRLGPRALEALERGLKAAPDALHYFDLAFETDGFRMMALNNLGAYVRSHVLGMPFGDQGLCMPRRAFLDLGGYDEQAPYGEDHLLVWAARRAGMALRCTGAPLTTSPRKYKEHGWLKTTLRHQALTLRQAWPQALQMLKRRP